MASTVLPALKASPYHSAGPRPSVRLLRVLLLVSLLIIVGAPNAWAQVQVGQSGQEKLATKYFTIYYPQGEEKSAQWYAGLADDVDVSVSDLLGSPPVQGITMRIYATEAEYMQANPMAELHPGILAHAI